VRGGRVTRHNEPGQSAEFEQAFQQAQALISRMNGYVSHQLHRSLEVPDSWVSSIGRVSGMGAPAPHFEALFPPEKPAQD